MPNVKSILNDIEKLPLHQKEQILSTLEEMVILGSQVCQVEQEVKEFRFSKGKVCPLCGSETISRNGNIMVNKDISASLVKRPLLTLLILQSKH